jgi:hypothetical protein
MFTVVCRLWVGCCRSCGRPVAGLVCAHVCGAVPALAGTALWRVRGGCLCPLAVCAGSCGCASAWRGWR